jgi:hypothetical protein
VESWLASEATSLSELKLIQNDRGDAIRIEAFEIAGTKAR